MRIERLTEDNARTQGATRRTWYRRHAPRHLATVEHLVERALAARGSEAPATVAVLGAGACTDIPLERLARACERVALVDLDAPGMARARQEVPANLRDRVRLVVCDLSGGVSDALGGLLRTQPWHDLAHLSAQAVGAAAASAVDRVPVPDPPPLVGLGEGRWGVVISACVVTQLFSLPLLDVRDEMALAASPGSAPDAEPRYQAAARAFRRRVALAHAHLLGRLVASGGSVLFMSDTTGHLLPPLDGPHAADPRESLPVLPADVMGIPHDFAPRLQLTGEPQTWEWLIAAPTADQHGRAYDAIGALFRPAEEGWPASGTPG